MQTIDISGQLAMIIDVQLCVLTWKYSWDIRIIQIYTCMLTLHTNICITHTYECVFIASNCVWLHVYLKASNVTVNKCMYANKGWIQMSCIQSMQRCKQSHVCIPRRYANICTISLVE